MVSANRITTLPEQTAICAAMVETVAKATKNQVRPDACICTFFLNESGEDVISIPFSRRHEDSDVMGLIRASSERKQITDEMNSKKTIPMESQHGTFEGYFGQNSENSLKKDEKEFAIENQYSVATSQYWAIPFPSGDLPNGVFFLFAHDEREASILKSHLDAITMEIENDFKK